MPISSSNDPLKVINVNIPRWWWWWWW